ncbi:MAG: hypothetical protein KIT83_17220 [Bryobacterales bacterium]|nr:hypothetical protein [Bryobacterales bacterium]
MAREERRKQRDLRRQQQEEATNRRREARHADLAAKGQADLRLRQAMLATLRPEEFVSQKGEVAHATSQSVPHTCNESATSAHQVCSNRREEEIA